MGITHTELRNRFITFWKKNGHAEIPPISLIPKDDPTTLFTGSGMQQFVPYLLGEIHPEGTRLFDIQPCLRAQDIEEVGDNRHTTMFEMLGNWSLGDYFKKEQLPWFLEFLVTEVKLDPKKLYVTVFNGGDGLSADTESVEIWKEQFKKNGVTAELQPENEPYDTDNYRIFPYGTKKNWWSRAGVPSAMPSGEPGGPDSEVFYDFGSPHDTAFGETCHPNCDCGRFMEIGNSVFMQYIKQDDGSFKELPKMNVDFGGGYERILAASNNNPDVFTTDLYKNIIQKIESETGKSYQDSENKAPMRVIADHLKAATFLIVEGLLPSNKQQGYVHRRLLRRAAIKMRELSGNTIKPEVFAAIGVQVLEMYEGVYFSVETHSTLVTTTITDEMNRFAKSLSEGLKEIEKLKTVSGKEAFDLYQTYGFPIEITEELLKQKGHTLDIAEFRSEFDKHRNLSRTSSAGMFKGGLADHSDQTLKYHTATHLMHQALYDVLGSEIRQEGSNITAERLRFDFYAKEKPTPEQAKEIENIINKKIEESLPVTFKIVPKDEALTLGAKSFFKEKYPDMVKVYYVGSDENHIKDAYSKEFCGGPHVTNTKDIGHIEVYKVEKIGANIFRIYAK